MLLRALDCVRYAHAASGRALDDARATAKVPLPTYDLD
jgi:hypothetical protein